LARARGGPQVRSSSSPPESGWTNTRLVEECVRGNERAWYAIVNRYKNLVYSIALSYGADAEDAADIFQLVWLDLFNELPRLREPEALQGWLKRVAIRKAYQWKLRRASSDGATPAVDDEMPSDGALTPETMQNIEREQLVREAVAKLSPRCREMVELLFFKQPPVPYAELAGRLGLATGSIGFIRGRCLKQLRTILKSKGF
jgi:RNA polymerase sigma factor (sigma-70 family)